MWTSSDPITVGYTIFNKADLIPTLISGLADCISKKDQLIFLLDCCSDNSEKVLKAELEKHKLDAAIFKNDTEQFEVRSNNQILKWAESDVVALFQDDIVLHDKQFKEKIANVITITGDNLGLMGARTGFELAGTEFPERAVRKVSNWEHKEEQYGERLLPWGFAYRTFLNRGPIVFTQKLIERAGYLDIDYFPQWGDDLDYCATCKYGLNLSNVVFECQVESKLEWGGMRKKNKKFNWGKVIKRNWNLFIQKWGGYVKESAELLN